MNANQIRKAETLAQARRDDAAKYHADRASEYGYFALLNLKKNNGSWRAVECAKKATREAKKAIRYGYRVREEK